VGGIDKCIKAFFSLLDAFFSKLFDLRWYFHRQFRIRHFRILRFAL